MRGWKAARGKIARILFFVDWAMQMLMLLIMALMPHYWPDWLHFLFRFLIIGSICIQIIIFFLDRAVSRKGFVESAYPQFAPIYNRSYKWMCWLILISGLLSLWIVNSIGTLRW